MNCCRCGCSQVVKKGQKFLKNHDKRVGRVIRYCFCGCNEKFKVKITSKKRFVSGHNGKLQPVGRTYEQMYGEIKAKEIKKRLRDSHLGQKAWNKGKLSPWTSERNRVSNPMWDGKIVEKAKRNGKGKGMISCEVRQCKCSCKGEFECKVNSKQVYIYGHNSRCRTIETREKLRWAVLCKIKNGLFVPSWKSCKRGEFYSKKNGKILRYMSSYELLAFQLLESMVNVRKYDVGFVRVSYKYKDKESIYVIDLYVEYTNGERQLIEIKPLYMLNDEKVIAKLKAGKRYAEKSGMGFLVWTEEILFTKEKEDKGGLG